MAGKTADGFIRRRPMVPAGRQQRVGDTQVLDNLYYDTLLYGAGQTIEPKNQLYTDANRTRKENLCNLKLQGQFTDNRQFAVYRFGLLVWSETNPNFYDWTVYFSRFEIEQDEARKQILWGDQAGAGGGVQGYDVNPGAFHLSNGVPASNNQWTFRYPLVIVPQESFVINHYVMSGFAGAYSPLNLINADDTDNRLFRVYIRGVEGRNPFNA